MHLVRQSEPIATLPIRGEGTDIYVLYEDAVPRWQLAVDWGESSPFREELVWPAAGLGVIGGGTDVYFLDLDTGEIRVRTAVRRYFGHLALHDDMLFVLGCSDLFAFDLTSRLLWRADDLAVDGITFGEVENGVVRVDAEMDPPGGWFSVAIDLATGREISRSPAFTDDYVGIYR